ncbi:retrotransposon protein, putative, ty1-copia subclass [Tanacetum coccineum]
MGPHINICNVTRDMKGSAPEPVKRETDTRVTCTVDALKHSETFCAIIENGENKFGQANIRGKRDEIGKSSRIDDEVVQDQRQRDDNDLQDERQDQPKEEEVEPRISKRARTKELSGNFLGMAQWKEAIKSEIDSILQNHTWELVDLLSGCKPLGYKWIFKKKMKADGTIDKYKARMVLAIAALRKLEVHQMDVKPAFLNGDLEEEIYMNQPEGFIAPGLESKVCSLNLDRVTLGFLKIHELSIMVSLLASKGKQVERRKDEVIGRKTNHCQISFKRCNGNAVYDVTTECFCEWILL